jgi:hypothetical protein
MCLMLRHGVCARDGVQMTLYDPKLTDIGHNFFKLRGFEPAQEGRSQWGTSKSGRCTLGRANPCLSLATLL